MAYGCYDEAVCTAPLGPIPKIEIISGPKNNSVLFWGFEDSELTITGSCFSSIDCQNKITIGHDRHQCVVREATPTSLKCNIKGNPGNINPLESLEILDITVNVFNQGKAFMNLPYPQMATFRLYPKLESNDLKEGSWGGGSVLTLSGHGLLPNGGIEAVQVIFGEPGTEKSCTIIVVEYKCWLTEPKLLFI